MNKSRKLLFWTICYIFSFASLVIAFPIILFTLYPYSIIAVALYAMSIIVLSVLSFRKSANRHTIYKKILFCMLLVPIIALLTILVAIETGWLHYPG